MLFVETRYLNNSDAVLSSVNMSWNQQGHARDLQAGDKRFSSSEDSLHLPNRKRPRGDHASVDDISSDSSSLVVDNYFGRNLQSSLESSDSQQSQVNAALNADQDWPDASLRQAPYNPARAHEIVDEKLTKASDDNNNNPPHYDTCFGVLEVTATSSIDSTDCPVPVSITSYDDISKISHKETTKYIGLITEPTIARLLGNCNVGISAHLHAEQAQAKGKAKKKVISTQSKVFFVRIVVYGTRDQSGSVRDTLSKGDLHLQAPLISDCKGDVQYHNPQYLLRPGSHVPQPHELLGELDSLMREQTEQIDEVTQSRVQHLLDSASNRVDSVSIDPSPRLKTALENHQLVALSFMVEKEAGILQSPTFPPLWEAQASGRRQKTQFRHSITGRTQTEPHTVNGGILADDMGLGKTLSLLALVCSSLDAREKLEGVSSPNNSRKTLIITPKSTLPGWRQQIETHLYSNTAQVLVYYGSSQDREAARFDDADIVLTTYDTVRLDSTLSTQPLTCQWYRVVLDEAHRIRNRSSRTSRAVCLLRSVHRWCLTGTPVQNSLDDFGALLGFIRVPHLENKAKFDHWIAGPLKKESGAKLDNLRRLISVTCLRRTKQRISESCKIPERRDRIEIVHFNAHERAVYEFFRQKIANIVADRFDIAGSASSFEDHNATKNILSLINVLRLVCNHGERLLPDFALRAWKDQDATAVTLQALYRSAETTTLVGDTSAGIARTTFGHEMGRQIISTESPAVKGQGSIPEPDRYMGQIAKSSKIEALLKNLHIEQRLQTRVAASQPEKSVVFSFWTKMLDMIEQALGERGYRYCRIDGRTTLDSRTKVLQEFNSNDSCTVMLASIGSAGEGVDFTASCNVHLVEPHWNPMAEAQAIDRVHRIGQKRTVSITRYITLDSIETYVQKVQRRKLDLIDVSIDATSSNRQLDIERWQALREFLT